MTRALTLIAVGLTMMVATASAQTQATVSATDIERLQFAVSDARADIAQLRGRNSTLADRLETQLEELSDEVVYLKVKARKERTVPRSEYSELRDRLDDLRSQARSGSQTPAATTSERRTEQPAATRRGNANEIPAGQELDVRLQTGLNSGTAAVEDRF
ncbi:MAG: hypothetical protein AB7I50_08635, partial [Vicinamibacterales bacterium]